MTVRFMLRSPNVLLRPTRLLLCAGRWSAPTVRARWPRRQRWF